MYISAPTAKFSLTILIALFALAGFFATFHLTESPPVWYDEGFYVQSASNLALYGQTGLRVAPDVIEPSSKLITVGYPLIYPLAGWFKIFGVDIFNARLLMVFFILGFLAMSYVLVRRLFGSSYALGSLALLATLPTLYGNGKSVLGEVPGLLYLTIGLLFAHFAVSNALHRRWTLIFAGLFAGLCIATKPTYLVLVPALLIGIFIEWRRSTLHPLDIVFAIVAGIIPVAVWFTVQFQGGDSIASIFSYYANPYQLSGLFGVILENTRRLFTSIGPLYLMGVMGIWALAFFIRLRAKEKIPTVEIVAFVFSILIIAAYTRTAGWYRYLFEAQALSLLFLPNSFAILARSVSLRSARVIVPVAIVFLAGFGAYQIMFSSFVAESYNRTKTAFLESYFVQVPPTRSFFFYNVPEAAIFIHGPNYYQYISAANWYIGQRELAAIDQEIVDAIMLGTDAYAAMGANAFPGYIVEEKNHDYTILEKI